MAENKSKFDIWWNSPEVKQKLGAAYSIGASVVIIGAMFKILHLQGAGVMLGVGMSVEAFLFALGIFDQPHKEYDWEKIYDFDGDGKVSADAKVVNSPAQNVVAPSRAVGLNYTETINDDDVKMLSEGIKSLTVTANQFSGLSEVLGATDKFVKNIDIASNVTGKYVQQQETLNNAVGQLTSSYQGISDGMEMVEKRTKNYATNVEDINKNLSSINSIYEIQLKNIQAQSEGLTLQTDRVRSVANELADVVGEVQKMKSATIVAAEETEKMKAGTTKLSKQIADLNQVYGNMLNALS
ncbi:MAG TPA: gliding motility protein GldL [Paludibacter sp.]|nr:gliding motility protein GldL [Paludibacter sp.]